MAKKNSKKKDTNITRVKADQMHKQTPFLRIGVIVIIAIMVGLLGYSVLNQNVLVPNQIVAKVNDQVITLKDFQTYAKFTRVEDISSYQQLNQYLSFYQQLGEAPDPQLQQQLSQIQQEMSDSNAFGQKVLNYMIEDALLVSEAKTLGITISDDEITKMFQDAFGYFPQGTPTPEITPTQYVAPTLSATQMAMVTFPTSTPDLTLTPTGTQLPQATPDLTLTPTVISSTATTEPLPTAENTPTAEPTPTLITLEGYQQALNKYMTQLTPYGLTENDLRHYVFYQFLYGKVYAGITKNVASHGEEVWVRDILVTSEADAQKVISRVNNGENWIALASELSQDSATKSNGGDLGWFPRGIETSEIESAAFNMKIGDIRSVQGANGWHVIQLVGHDQDRPFSDNVFSYLKDKTFNDWYTTTKNSAQIQTYDVWKTNVPTQPMLPTPAQ